MSQLFSLHVFVYLHTHFIFFIALTGYKNILLKNNMTLMDVYQDIKVLCY